MSVVLVGRQIESVSIIDDDENARQSVALTVRDAKLNPILEEGPIPNLDEFVVTIMNTAHAAFFDHHLGRLATFYGAEAVALLYRSKFPAVLCTAWAKADLDTIRRHRRDIPVLLRTEEADPDSILKGFECCLQEFDGHPTPSRKPWRTLIRVEDVDTKPHYKRLFVVLPAWNSKEIISLPLDLIPEKNRANIQPGTRFHAQVNIGAEGQDELYFDSFEFNGTG